MGPFSIKGFLGAATVMVLSVGGRDRRPKTVKSFLPLNLVTNGYYPSEVRQIPEWVRVFGLNPDIELGSVRQARVKWGKPSSHGVSLIFLWTDEKWPINFF